MVKKLDLPQYDKIDELILVGTNHYHKSNQDQNKKYKFLKEISGMDHLILEGTQSTYTSKKFSEFPNFEMFAYVNKPSSTIFIEDGEDFIEKNGIRKDLFGLYMFFFNIPFVMKATKKTNKPMEITRSLIDSLDENYFHINKEITLNQFSTVIENHKNLIALFKIGQQWVHHSSRNRDHYIFGPKSLQLKEELEGKVVEIVGYNHFLFLQKYLRGEKITPPLMFKETLEDNERKIVEDIEERLFKI